MKKLKWVCLCMVLYLGAQQVAASLDETDMGSDVHPPTGPRATTEIWAAVNLPACDPLDACYTTPMKVYDSSGDAYDLELNWRHVSLNPPVWQLIVSSQDTPNHVLGPIRLTFDAWGNRTDNEGPWPLKFGWGSGTNGKISQKMTLALSGAFPENSVTSYAFPYTIKSLYQDGTPTEPDTQEEIPPLESF